MKTKMITRKQIIKAIGNENLTLERGEGYFYFVFDDGINFETHSVYTNSLNGGGDLDYWVNEGIDFIKELE